ncbi:helix-turn-helix transcriptional regulator [Kalamiella sp. sgz302252]|uniref:helix-turn-helix domain-containing protein n=1 Tax=Pantoea sp. sgz302252 TaxID=3341827 RepID=UPI0036D327C3
MFKVIAAEEDPARMEADIIFRDIIITIFCKKESSDPFRGKNKADKQVTALHIPFICRGDNLPQITGKIKKILMIANMNAASLTSREGYKINGLKEFMQLSSTESKVMLMIGQGYDAEAISRILGRSEKTVHTHCRNAIRKMGMLNRMDFYRYASFIARSEGKKGNTLCL